MAELSIDDVVDFTGGRLEDNDVTQAILDAALARARRYCGWHVTPIADTLLIMTGSGTTRLRLPSRRILNVNDCDNNGVDVAGSGITSLVVIDPEVPGVIELSSGVWSTVTAGITIDFNHGYTDIEAADWRYAVLSMVDQMASTAGRPDADLVEKTVDAVTYRWGQAGEQALYSVIPVFQDYEVRPVFLS